MAPALVVAIVFLPLFGALVAGLFCRVISKGFAHFITCACMVSSAILASVAFYHVILKKEIYHITLLRWFESAGFHASWSVYVDGLTAVMLVVVTWVSTLVHIYSVGYMGHDKHQQRFMSYLSLFTFCMLMLVTSDNFVQLFFGWEGVGLCSYLLIGFWYERPSANAAAIKAFVVNRVGDFGFALGIFAVFMVFGSVVFQDVFAASLEKGGAMINIFGKDYHALTVICGLLFIGCMGKSAQLGLHTWLPDAMEGPTPVSALIHAATMVTAGVFLVARCSPLFELAPAVLDAVTFIGAATALFAGTIAITQNDIKRVIAYSTCSQLGYMFFACGVSAYSAGIFHLMTHAFFKALLFLGAGSVIHAMSDEQDIRKMGGIWKKIPVTYVLMWIGSLALAGIPPFAGFYSKDIILESAYAAGTPMGMFAYWVGIAAAFLTAFYSWRLLILTFHGTSRASDEVLHHVHESPKVMLVPLFLLATGAVVAGYIGSVWLGIAKPDLSFWNGALVMLGANNVLEEAHHVPALIKYMPLIVGIAGIALAYVFYLFIPAFPGAISRTFRPVYKFFLNKWYIDELYDFLFVRPAKASGKFLWQVFDTMVIDGLGPNGFAWVSQRVAVAVSRLQTGLIYHYAFVMLIGMVALISWYLWYIAL